MRLLLDEMYPPTLAALLRDAGVDATGIIELRLAGASDARVFRTAAEYEAALLTENVADFIQLAAEHITAGRHHPGLLVALSSRFSQRPSRAPSPVAAVRTVEYEDLHDRVVFLARRSVEPAHRHVRV